MQQLKSETISGTQGAMGRSFFLRRSVMVMRCFSLDQTEGLTDLTTSFSA